MLAIVVVMVGLSTVLVLVPGHALCCPDCGLPASLAGGDALVLERIERHAECVGDFAICHFQVSADEAMVKTSREMLEFARSIGLT